MTNIKIIATTEQEMQAVVSKAVSNAFHQFRETFLETLKAEEDENFSYSEAAAYLKVSKPTIHSYKNQGILPFYQAGRTVYFKKSEIDAAFANNKGGL